jgi:O-antigen/teichoic acid export membrane protein
MTDRGRAAQLVGLGRHHFQSIMALAIRGLSVLAGFALSFVIGHRFGPEANGTYALITQSAMFLSVVAVGGLDLAVVRQFSSVIAKGQQLSAATLLRVVGLSMGFAAAIIAALLGGGPATLHWAVGGILPAGGLFILCILLWSRAMTRIGSAVLRSQKRYILGQSVEVLMIPTLALSVIAAGWVRGIDPILWLTAAVSAAVAIGGLIASFAGTSRAAEAASLPIRPIIRIALPLWGVAIALNIADWYGLVVVANVAGIYDAGLYRIAMQFGTSLAIVSMGLFSVFSPQISAAWANEDLVGVARLGRTATRLSALFTLPPALLMLVIAEPLLGLIGSEFIAAAPMLRIIVIGQMIYTISGPAGLVLAMTGHERVNFAITLTSTLSLILFAPPIAQVFGAAGVATCVALFLVGRNVVSLYFVHRLCGINPLTGSVRPQEGKPLT